MLPTCTSASRVRPPRRGDSAAEYAAFLASWQLEEADRWRSFAALARAAWPVRDDAVPELRDAFERCLADSDQDGIAEWADAFCEASAVSGDWQAIDDVASRATAVLGAPREDGPLLEIHLDLLDARAALGQQVDAEFNGLLLATGALADAVPRIRARYGVVLARAGRGKDAALSFREAAAGWLAAGDAEEEMGEAVFSEDVVSQRLGVGRRLDQVDRIAVGELRGRSLSYAVLAERRETEGLRAYLDGGWWPALRGLTIAWSLHRRAGHLRGCHSVALALWSLHRGDEQWADALRWAIAAGHQIEAGECARHATWPEIHECLRIDGAPWESGPSFEAMAEAGATATDHDVAAIVPKLLARAAQHEPTEAVEVQSSAAAPRALATLLCAIPAQHLNAAVAEVLHELRTSPYPPRQALHGLIQATDAGRVDGAAAIAVEFCRHDRHHLGGYGGALRLIAGSDEARSAVSQRASLLPQALVLAAWLDLPDDDGSLAARAADLAHRALTGALDPIENPSVADRGCLARWASPEDRQATAELMLGILTGEVPDDRRDEAAAGLAAVAPSLEPDAASAALDRLLGSAEALARPWTLDPDDPDLPQGTIFGAVSPSIAAVRAEALRGACALATRAGRLADVAPQVTAARADPEPALRIAAIRLGRRYRELPDADAIALLNDEDPHAISRTGPVAGGGSAAGRYRSNRVPRPTADSHSTHPSNCWAVWYTIGKPSPVPWPTGLVVKNGSKIRAWTSGVIPVPVSADRSATTYRPGRTSGRAGRRRRRPSPEFDVPCLDR